MSECSKCRASVPLDSTVCPECGAPVTFDAGSAAEPSESDAVVHSLLLSAYVLKLRGDLDAAVAECIKALRVNPDSVEAHSLLGDIYRAQGKTEDAMHWYKLALDLNPESEADRARLDHLLRQEPSLRRPSDVKPAPAPAPTVSHLAFVALAAIVCVLTAAVIWLLVLQRPVDIPAVPMTRPSRTPPVVIGRTARPGEDARNVISEPAPIASTREIGIMAYLNGSPSLTSRGLHVLSAHVDPRDQSAVITFIGPSPDGEPVSEALARNSLIVLKEAFLHDDALASATVRTLYSVQEGEATHPEIVFISDAQRGATLQSNPESAAYSNLSAVLINPWWRSQ